MSRHDRSEVCRSFEGLSNRRICATHQGHCSVAPFQSSGVRTEKLDSDVLVMKPPDQGMRHDASNPLNWARDRRILV